MLAALVIAMREGLEAALITAIVVAYLNRTGRARLLRAVWSGVALAVVASALIGVGFLAVAGGYGGKSEELFEAGAMLLAVLVISYMVVWMRKQSASRGKTLEKQVDEAATAGSALALGGLVFLAVVREGLELVLFLYAAFLGSSALATSTGMVAGLGAAVLLAFALYRGSLRISLRNFFTYTGILLILFAAGLLGQSVKILQEFAYLPPTEPVWNTGALLSANGPVGVLLGTLFGYDPEPTLLQLGSYVAYVVTGLTLFSTYSARKSLAAVVASLILLGGAFGWSSMNPGGESSELVAETADVLKTGARVQFAARQYEFRPGQLTVEPGAQITLIARSEDVPHGVGYPGGNQIAVQGRDIEITFRAPGTPGVYTYYCTLPCGTGHDEMKWTLVVRGP